MTILTDGSAWRVGMRLAHKTKRRRKMKITIRKRIKSKSRSRNTA